MNDDTIMEDSRPATPGVGDQPLQSGKQRRKSATFWRRKSSLTLGETMNAEKQAWVGGGGDRNPSDVGKMQPLQPLQQTNGNGNGHARGTEPATHNLMGRKMSKRSEPEDEMEYQPPPSPVKRSYSPPPQLPEFVGGGGGLGLKDDFFDGLAGVGEVQRFGMGR